MDSLLQIGLLLACGLLAEYLGRKTALPRVSVLIGLGLLLGQSGVQLIPAPSSSWFTQVSQIALSMVGFLLGGKLWGQQPRPGIELWHYSLAITLVTGLVVGVGLWLLGQPWQVALILAGVALATDPLATMDAMRNIAPSNLTRMLTGIVALDDVWGLLLFSLAISLLGSQSVNGFSPLLHGLTELLFSIGLGAVLGVIGGWLSGRLREGEPILLEALALVFLSAGLSRLWELNYLLVAIAMGAAVARTARHHERPFHEIELIEWPFLVIFLVLTGASFELHSFNGTVLLVGLYALLRIAGRWIGGSLPGTSSLTYAERRKVGLCLLPQAGVAVGIALYGAQIFPAYADAIIHATVLATIGFELLGPVITHYQLREPAMTHRT